MKKIPSLFRYVDDKPGLYTQEVNPLCQWVIDGEGISTRKWDGTACMVRAGKLFARYDAKVDKQTLKPLRPVPEGFEPVQEPDPITGHWPGWIPASDDPRFKWHREAWQARAQKELEDGTGLDNIDGTYELCGPKVNKSEGLSGHVLIKHGERDVPISSRSFEDLMKALQINVIEGLVFHHPDGRMAKVTRYGFGLPWG